MFFYKNGDDIEIRPEIIAKAGQYENKDWKLVLYPETSRGIISTRNPTGLSSRVLSFNPTSEKSIRRMLANLVFYTVFTPMCLASVKITERIYFLSYDPFGLHTNEYINSIASRSGSNILRPNNFFWKEGNGFFTDLEYKKFIEDFRSGSGNNYNEKYITPLDLRNFLKFKPPRGQNMNIELYLIEKFSQLLEGSFEENFFSKDINLIENLFN
jgi:hypothetical protein